MKPLSTDEIREIFLSFFAERGHERVASSPLVPSNDPTLLFTNAGMVQFKDVFTGKESRPYKTATTAQKCVRAGGKHNDLENVGYTPRHHTFFEMLGNFSFGDYFKKDAIAHAWTLTTEVFGLPKDRLCVTVFEGDDEIPADDEAAKLWESVGVPPERILRLSRKDNYWQMGDTGPQGPCSEIHYFTADDTDHMFDGTRVADSDGWVEIWNLVFMQFSKESADSKIEPLPSPSIDTGAGLERIATILQGKPSNYETDGFRVLIDAIAESVGKPYGESAAADDVSMRVIADHSRAAAFLIADGVQPSNEGRGYVLRRIMRRAIRHGSRLGFGDLFFHEACGRVVDRMVGAYPELERARSLIEKVAQSEETAFRRTLDRGLKLLRDEMSALDDKGALSPEFVARLYHTFGFPIDLTRVIAEEEGYEVDEAAAHQAVADSNPEQDASLGGGEAIDAVWFAIREAVEATEFVGYTSDSASGKVVALVSGDAQVDSVSAPAEVHVVLDATPFYGESGGQVGDIGELVADGVRVEVTDTKKPRPDLVVHVGKLTQGSLQVGAAVSANVDSTARDATRRNHSATHLLHLVLKEVLGDHVQQKGSLVAPDRLRFDYSHFEPVSAAQSDAIEARVNAMVLADAATETNVSSLDGAREAGAMMLFGEKYDDEVRMVRIGADSLELCGGIHVRRAGEIGLVKIVSDAAIASGVRRLEAVTGMGALAWTQAQSSVAQQAAAAMKTSVELVPDRIDKLLRRNKELERELEKAKAEAAMGGSAGGDVMDHAEVINGIKVLVHRADGTPRKALRSVSDKLRDRLGSGVVVLGAKDEDKAALLVAVTKDLVGSVHAGNVVKAAAAAMSGSGGGRPDFAQGGGKAELLDAALAKAKDVLATMSAS